MAVKTKRLALVTSCLALYQDTAVLNRLLLGQGQGDQLCSSSRQLLSIIICCVLCVEFLLHVLWNITAFLRRCNERLGYLPLNSYNNVSVDLLYHLYLFLFVISYQCRLHFFVIEVSSSELWFPLHVLFVKLKYYFDGRCDDGVIGCLATCNGFDSHTEQL